jgi:F-type H+-transporting ATPase subunit a
VAESPLEQFKIERLADIRLGGIDASFTNSSLFMVAAIIVITLFLVLGMRRAELVPGRWQSMAELTYEFIANMVRENVGSEGRKYFPFVFSLFMFILVGNLLGMIPYSFTFTSHIIVTFAMALTVFLLVTIVAFVRHGFHFFTFFFPHGAPIVLAPLLIPIEVLSYLTRPVSLSITLFELLVAVLQAYVFTILTCLYLKDAIELH